MRGLAQVLQELDKTSVAFRSAAEPFDTGSPAGRIMVQMLGVSAESERAAQSHSAIGSIGRLVPRSRAGRSAGHPTHLDQYVKDASALAPSRYLSLPPPLCRLPLFSCSRSAETPAWVIFSVHRAWEESSKR